MKRETNVRVAETLLRHVEPACAGYMNAGYLRLCHKALRLALRTGDFRGAVRSLSKAALGIARQPLLDRTARLAARQRVGSDPHGCSSVRP